MALLAAGSATVGACEPREAVTSRQAFARVFGLTSLASSFTMRCQGMLRTSWSMYDANL